MIAALRDGRLRKLRKLIALLRPYRGRVLVMMVALRAWPPPRRSCRPTSPGLAIDEGIRAGDTGALTMITAAFVASALVYWGATYARDLPDQLGRPAARSRTCACRSSPTSSGCRSASTRATRRAC